MVLALPCACFCVHHGNASMYVPLHIQPSGPFVSPYSLVSPNLNWTAGRTLGLLELFGKSGEGRSLFTFFSSTYLSIFSINKFGHVLRLPLQFLNTERNQPSKVLILPITHIPPVPEIHSVWHWAPPQSVYSISVLTLLLCETGRKLLCFCFGPLWDILLSAAGKDPFSLSLLLIQTHKSILAVLEWLTIGFLSVIYTHINNYLVDFFWYRTWCLMAGDINWKTGI